MSYVPKRRAPIWRFYKDTDPPQKEKAMCNVGGCKKIVPCRNGGTSGVKDHLRVHHPLQFTELKRQECKQKNSDTPGEEEVDDDFDVTLEGEGDDNERPESALSSTSSVSLLSPQTSTQDSADANLRSPPPTPVSRPASALSGSSRQQKLDSYRPLPVKEKERCDSAVAYYIVTCMRPLNTVDKPGFRKMVKVLNPKYEPPSRRTLTGNHIPKMYNAARENVTLLLKQADYVALTTDGWTSGAHTSYLSLTAHFLDNEWTLVDVTLNCKQILEDHSGLQLRTEIQGMLAEWNLKTDAIAAFTTDNGDNIRVALDLLGLSKVHMRCFAHTVNNGVTAFTGECNALDDALKRATALRSFMSSDKVWRHYEKHIVSRYDKKPSRLPAPCKSRWWVDLNLAQAVVAQHSWLMDFMATYERGKHVQEVPSVMDISVLKSYIQAMKPVEKICTFLGAQKYCSASFILPAMYLLDPQSPMYGGDDLESLGTTAPEENEEDFDEIPLSENPELIPTRIQRVISNKLKKRFKPKDLPEGSCTEAVMKAGQHCYELCVRASYLDPRFRNEILEEDRETAKDLLLKDEALQAENSSTPGKYFFNYNQTDGGAGSSGSRADAATAQAVSALSGLFKKRRLHSALNQSSISTEERFHQEIAKYEMLPAEDLEVCPFKWWKTHQAAFPLLSKLAKKYLSIPATSLPSERLFSTAGDVLTDTRNCLSGENAEMLIFCAVNQ
ncbi:E3 SUMO-protein ligase ZBED1, partial [Frankliniella fusca]